LADSAILLRRGFYNIAIERLDEGRYTDAYEVFSLLGGFEDSEMYAAECYRYVSYQEGARLFQSGEHAKAREIFAELGDFRDSADMLEACDNYIRYNRALELYAEEKYGQAHAIFAELGNFEDSAERMAKCVRPAPQNGIVEKGPAYVGGQAEFAIHNNKSKDMCFGIRDADGGDWGLIYVRAGEKAIVKIPPGEYSMSAGIGDNWFGAIDLFGLQTVDGVQYVETTLVDGRPSFAVPAAGYDYYTSF
jgi:tetratricopeptide (TPR) repeat protein